MPEGVLGVEKRGTNDISYFLSISSSHIINIYIIILSNYYQQSTLNIHDETVHVSPGVISAPMGSDFQANPTKNSFVDNFGFTKAEDILFALEMNSESVYNLLYKRINRKFAKATVHTSIIEVLATVVLRCFNKDAT